MTPVSWYEKILRKPGRARDTTRLLKLRCTRFRQLIRNYGRVLDAIADAADKQDGEYIFDRQYVVSLSEMVIDLADAIVFDLNVLTHQRCADFYRALDRFRIEARELIAAERDAGRKRDDDEQAVFRTLSALRQSMLSFSLGVGGGSGAALDDCKTVYDLAHLAHELACESQRSLIANHGDGKGSVATFVIGVDTPVRAIDVGNGMEQTGTEESPREAIRSTPLRVLVGGMDQSFRREAAAWTRVAPATLTAVVTEDHAHAILHQPTGFDLVDATTIGSKEANHVYCRFASRIRGDEDAGVRGVVAREILTRLGFSTALTARAAMGLLRTVPRFEAEERLLAIGRLAAFTLARDAAGWESIPSEAHIEAFMTQQT